MSKHVVLISGLQTVDSFQMRSNLPTKYDVIRIKNKYLVSEIKNTKQVFKRFFH